MSLNAVDIVTNTGAQIVDESGNVLVTNQSPAAFYPSGLDSSSFLSNFTEWQNVTVVVQSKGTATGVSADGRPTYGDPVVKHDARAWMWLLSASEQLICDRMGNPSTHKVVLDPLNVTAEIAPEDTCTIDGEEFKLYRADDIMQTEEVIVFTAARKR